MSSIPSRSISSKNLTLTLQRMIGLTLLSLLTACVLEESTKKGILGTITTKPSRTLHEHVISLLPTSPEKTTVYECAIQEAFNHDTGKGILHIPHLDEGIGISNQRVRQGNHYPDGTPAKRFDIHSGYRSRLFSRNQAALAKYAGLAWTQRQSGYFEVQNTRRIQSGNRFLKYYLCEAAFSLVRCAKEYNAFYHQKYKEVNRYQHKHALTLTTRKFVRLVFARLKDYRLCRSAE